MSLSSKFTNWEGRSTSWKSNTKCILQHYERGAYPLGILKSSPFIAPEMRSVCQKSRAHALPSTTFYRIGQTFMSLQVLFAASWWHVGCHWVEWVKYVLTPGKV
ncbi:hypothetical protein CEXT_755621 [Caerostris extrusa]|uniref:Uncharacterized protein n=1 Tax=Caerostris extrusa TaxID=172846 RepID=A0AAV4NQR8_CAEEX|nr:hypothetical protein CEXT_755621 [Caerostris extrusa]